MKKIIFNSLTVAFCLAILGSCNKDEISIEKNESTAWEIDKKIVDDDIRTRIGYDPRFDYVTPTTSEVVAPMLTLEGFTFADKNTRTLEVKLTKASDKDVTVSLMYDASLFSKIAGNYSGYELGDASLAEIATTQKTIAAGTTTTTFEIKVTNQSTFNKKVILPFAVKASNNEFVKTLSGKDYFVVRIYPKALTFDTANKKIIKEAVLKAGKAELTNKVVNIAITSSDAIGTPISLGLERDNSLLTSGTLAPENIVGTISKVDFKDKTSATISFTLQNIESISAKGTYVVPFKLMAYDASGMGHKVLDTPILLNIEVGDEGIPTDNEVEVSTDYSVTMMNSSKYSFETNYMPGHVEKMHDGNLYGNPWWIDTSIDEDSDDSPYVYVHFTSKTLINGIRITQNTSEKRIGQVFIYAVTDEGSYIHQGTYDASGSQKPRFLYIKFKKPIKASKLYLAYFRNSDNQYIDINEMQFF
ncbi:DUF1735 domain-containing protein [Capnocytophaga sputigena]|jgi:hypothetical protein|uniref:DUF1735 domain-containing protein n=1 Tax=Capnocytophaga sputigena TaxID=1019 RepID=UPI0028D0366B|nr:DUF1735 domain-containing protein [Capnocytophaga sputigena]